MFARLLDLILSACRRAPDGFEWMSCSERSGACRGGAQGYLQSDWWPLRVMTPRRYNAVYDLIGSYARCASRNGTSPRQSPMLVSSLMRVVWNTEEEILSREDHPYRYDYEVPLPFSSCSVRCK